MLILEVVRQNKLLPKSEYAHDNPLCHRHTVNALTRGDVYVCFRDERVVNDKIDAGGEDVEQLETRFASDRTAPRGVRLANLGR